MFIYLAHAIDQAGTSPILRRMIGEVKSGLVQQGISAFMPGKAYQLTGNEDLRAVTDVNNHALWTADGVIAILAPGVPSLGTPVEIERALTFNKPTLIVTTGSIADNTVQMVDWMRRGAQVRLTNEDGFWFNGQDAPNLMDALRSLPNPTLLVTGPTDDLLVSGQAANLVQGKYQGDAGLDLALSGDEHLDAGEYRMLPTGIHVAIPDGYFGWITGRSSTWAKHRCHIKDAIIDSGYRGELMVGVTNGRPTTDIQFEAGTRLAQMILLPVFTGARLDVDVLPDHERGHAGYGSSGH